MRSMRKMEKNGKALFKLQKPNCCSCQEHCLIAAAGLRRPCSTQSLLWHWRQGGRVPWWSMWLSPINAECIAMLMSCSHPTQFWWLSREGNGPWNDVLFQLPRQLIGGIALGPQRSLLAAPNKKGQVEIRLASPSSMSLLILFGPLVCQCFAMFQLLNFDLLNLFTACWGDWTGQNALVFKPDTAKDCLRIRLLHYQSLETHSLAVGTDRGPFFPEQSLSQSLRIS